MHQEKSKKKKEEVEVETEEAEKSSILVDLMKKIIRTWKLFLTPALQFKSNQVKNYAVFRAFFLC